MRKLLARCLVCVHAFIAVVVAHAQGPPPPIEIASDTSQTVEMTLSLRDVRPGDDVTMYSPNGERVTRTQSGGNTKRGELAIYPKGVVLCGDLIPGLFGCLEPLDGDPAPFYVYEFPSVVKGALDPWFTTGEIENSGGGYLDDAPESATSSSFQHRQGRLDVRARVQTPDIGVWDFREDRYHQISAIASASLGDWIYVTGAGPTATLVVNASIDEEIDDPVEILNSNDWITEGVGDLRELPVCGGSGPIAYADQYTRFFYRFQVTNWELMQGNWTASPVASRSLEERRYSYLDYPPVDICNSDPIIVQQDTAPMPNADEFQATVPTNRWLSIDALVVAESECGGSLACNLLAQSGDPVAISLSSPDATIVSWQGIAGTTRVPEPGAAAGSAMMIGALVALVRRRALQRRDAVAARRSEVSRAPASRRRIP